MFRIERICWDLDRGKMRTFREDIVDAWMAHVLYDAITQDPPIYLAALGLYEGHDQTWKLRYWGARDLAYDLCKGNALTGEFMAKGSQGVGSGNTTLDIVCRSALRGWGYHSSEKAPEEPQKPRVRPKGEIADFKDGYDPKSDPRFQHIRLRSTISSGTFGNSDAIDLISDILSARQAYKVTASAPELWKCQVRVNGLPHIGKAWVLATKPAKDLT